MNLYTVRFKARTLWGRAHQLNYLNKLSIKFLNPTWQGGLAVGYQGALATNDGDGDENVTKQ